MCTLFSIIPDDQGKQDNCLTVRTTDWPNELNAEIWFVPAFVEGSEEAPLMAFHDNTSPELKAVIKDLRRWKNKYAYFGMTGQDPVDPAANPIPLFGEGMNEEGLTASILYFNEGKVQCNPLEMTAGAPPPEEYRNYFDIGSFVEYVLGNYENVSDIIGDITQGDPSVFPITTISKETLKVIGIEISNPGPTQPQLYPTPFHIHVSDAKGGRAVLEWMDGELKVFCTCSEDIVVEKAGEACNVMTNSPPYDWHLENMRWHTWLALTNRQYESSTTLPCGYVIETAAANLGLNGLSADLSSPTRFLRAVVLSALTQRQLEKDGPENKVKLVNHLLSLGNILAIPKGYRHDLPVESTSQPDQLEANRGARTLYISVRDQVEKVLYVQSYERKIPLRFDFKNYQGLEQTKSLAIDDPETGHYWLDTPLA